MDINYLLEMLKPGLMLVLNGTVQKVEGEVPASIERGYMKAGSYSIYRIGENTRVDLKGV